MASWLLSGYEKKNVPSCKMVMVMKNMTSAEQKEKEEELRRRQKEKEKSLPGQIFQNFNNKNNNNNNLSNSTRYHFTYWQQYIQEDRILLHNLWLTTSPLPAMVLIIAWRNSSISSPPPPSSSASYKSVMSSNLRQVLIPFIFLIWYCFLNWPAIRGIHILRCPKRIPGENGKVPKLSNLRKQSSFFAPCPSGRQRRRTAVFAGCWDYAE